MGLSKDNLSQLYVASCGVVHLANGESAFRILFSHGGEFDAVHWLGGQPGPKAEVSVLLHIGLSLLGLLALLTAWGLGSEIKHQERSKRQCMALFTSYPYLKITGNHFYYTLLSEAAIKFQQAIRERDTNFGS